MTQQGGTDGGGYHMPVLRDQAVDYLLTDPDGIYVDGTLGGGGHSRVILERLGPGGQLIGLDRDPEAIEACRAAIGPGETRLTLVQGNFGDLREILDSRGLEAITGILLDLGVSSRHLDEGQRGFSFMRPGPLDMRMGPDAGTTAAQLVNTLPVEELVRIFRAYGEEPKARRAARAIEAAREREWIETTTVLAQIIEEALGRRSGKHPATRVFQALRMAVNGELDALASFLDGVETMLTPGGRVVVISYHSLEDRMVKQAFRQREPHCICPSFAPRCTCGHPGTLRSRPRRAVAPDEEEIRRNSRARSAKLRVAERLGDPTQTEGRQVDGH